MPNFMREAICRCGTEEYPRLDPACLIHWALLLDDEPRLTLAEPTPQKVWILWRNDRMLCVCGTYDRAWKELHDRMTAIGGVWSKATADAHVWVNAREGTGLRIEAREVHR